MKNRPILASIVVALVVVGGCAKDPDARFADHAPGARTAIRLATFTPQKPGIPMPKPTAGPPAVLR